MLPAVLSSSPIAIHRRALATVLSRLRQSPPADIPLSERQFLDSTTFAALTDCRDYWTLPESSRNGPRVLDYIGPGDSNSAECSEIITTMEGYLIWPTCAQFLSAALDAEYKLFVRSQDGLRAVIIQRGPMNNSKLVHSACDQGTIAWITFVFHVRAIFHVIYVRSYNTHRRTLIPGARPVQFQKTS